MARNLIKKGDTVRNSIRGFGIIRQERMCKDKNYRYRAYVIPECILHDMGFKVEEDLGIEPVTKKRFIRKIRFKQFEKPKDLVL